MECLKEPLSDPSPTGLLPTVAELATVLATPLRRTDGGGTSGGTSEDGVKGFLAPEVDRSGFGGHTSTCKGEGGMSLDECRQHLLSVRGACDGLSFKDGQCYTHKTTAAGFYTDTSMGHLFQKLMP